VSLKKPMAESEGTRLIGPLKWRY